MISIIMPVLNEGDVLHEFYRRMVKVMEDVGIPCEFIFTGNGSVDKSMDMLMDLREKDRRVKILKFTRNFGHQAAIMAGLDYACGEAVITIDADLQHPPELIPKLIEKWQEGYKVVYTCRRFTAGSGALKNAIPRFFSAFINCLSEVSIPSGAADFRLLDRSVVESLQRLDERTLFLRGLVSWVGFDQTGVPYDADARYAGESKYSFIKLLRYAIDGITSFSSIPLYLAGFIGVVISMLSFLYAAFVIYAWLFTDLSVPGWTSVLVMVLFLGGIHLITVGIQGAYLGRIYREVKRRPRYLIQRAYGFKEENR